MCVFPLHDLFISLSLSVCLILMYSVNHANASVCCNRARVLQALMFTPLLLYWVTRTCGDTASVSTFSQDTDPPYLTVADKMRTQSMWVEGHGKLNTLLIKHFIYTCTYTYMCIHAAPYTLIILSWKPFIIICCQIVKLARCIHCFDPIPIIILMHNASHTFFLNVPHAAF